MSNNAVSNKMSFSVVVNSTSFQKSINNALRDPERTRRFTASIVSAVSTNPDLQACDASTIVTAALLGESLNLSPSPQLGQYYLVPYNDKKRGKVAQFQLGYKGYIQLAIRSGYYKKLNVLAVKEGELVRFDPLEEVIEVNLIEDEKVREETPTIGYYAMFEYQNGFRKALYWSKSKMGRHAEQYSHGYKAKKGYTFWEKDFDSMAYKTMLRQLISKWGIMSIEMQDVFAKDMAVLNDDGTADYVDTQEEIITQEEPDEIGVPQVGAMTEAEAAESLDTASPLSMDDI